jgi:outer membrane murein-binding lipoprotein Lpp
MLPLNLKERSAAFSAVYKNSWQLIGVFCALFATVVAVPYLALCINISVFEERFQKLQVLLNKMNSINAIAQRVNTDKALAQLPEQRKDIDRMLAAVREDSIHYPPEYRQVLTIYQTTTKFMGRLKPTDRATDRKELEAEIKTLEKALAAD